VFAIVVGRSFYKYVNEKEIGDKKERKKKQTKKLVRG